MQKSISRYRGCVLFIENLCLTDLTLPVPWHSELVSVVPVLSLRQREVLRCRAWRCWWWKKWQKDDYQVRKFIHCFSSRPMSPCRHGICYSSQTRPSFAAVGHRVNPRYSQSRCPSARGSSETPSTWATKPLEPGKYVQELCPFSLLHYKPWSIPRQPACCIPQPVTL